MLFKHLFTAQTVLASAILLKVTRRTPILACYAALMGCALCANDGQVGPPGHSKG